MVKQPGTRDFSHTRQLEEKGVKMGKPGSKPNRPFYENCRTCGIYGHSQRQCPYEGKGFRWNCNLCGLLGHPAAECPYYVFSLEESDGSGQGQDGGMDMGGQSGTGKGPGTEDGKDAAMIGGAFGVFNVEDEDEAGNEDVDSEPETVIGEDKDEDCRRALATLLDAGAHVDVTP